MSIYKFKKYIQYENLLKHGLVKLKTTYVFVLQEKMLETTNHIYKTQFELKISSYRIMTNRNSNFAKLRLYIILEAD